MQNQWQLCVVDYDQLADKLRRFGLNDEANWISEETSHGIYKNGTILFFVSATSIPYDNFMRNRDDNVLDVLGVYDSVVKFLANSTLFGGINFANVYDPSGGTFGTILMDSLVPILSADVKMKYELKYGIDLSKWTGK